MKIKEKAWQLHTKQMLHTTCIKQHGNIHITLSRNFQHTHTKKTTLYADAFSHCAKLLLRQAKRSKFKKRKDAAKLNVSQLPLSYADTRLRTSHAILCTGTAGMTWGGTLSHEFAVASGPYMPHRWQNWTSFWGAPIPWYTAHNLSAKRLPKAAACNQFSAWPGIIGWHPARAAAKLKPTGEAASVFKWFDAIKHANTVLKGVSYWFCALS